MTCNNVETGYILARGVVCVLPEFAKWDRSEWHWSVTDVVRWEMTAEMIAEMTAAGVQIWTLRETQTTWWELGAQQIWYSKTIVTTFSNIPLPAPPSPNIFYSLIHGEGEVQSAKKGVCRNQQFRDYEELVRTGEYEVRGWYWAVILSCSIRPSQHFSWWEDTSRRTMYTHTILSDILPLSWYIYLLLLFSFFNLIKQSSDTF